MQFSSSSQSLIPTLRRPGRGASSIGHPLDLLAGRGYPRHVGCAVPSTGRWTAADTAAGQPPRRNVQLLLSLTFSFSLFLSPSYALWKTKQKHFTAFAADKNLLSNSEKDHFCSSKEILMLVCFIGANKKQILKLCCFLGLPFYT